MASNVRHVSKFSPDNKLFAFINDQGILKIWDTETNELKQEFTPNLHLSTPCTSLVWVLAGQQKKKRRSKRIQNDENDSISETLYLAMGTSQGGVCMYSYASGKIERTFNGDGHSSKVNDITYDNKNLLYTCGDDYQIIVWNILKEKKINSWLIENEKPTSLLYLEQTNSLFIGGRQLKQYSCETEELLQTFIGHTSEIILLKSFQYNNIEYVLSASKMERIICLWTTCRLNKQNNAFCTFIMEDIAHNISCKLDKNHNLEICAVTRSGVVHFYGNNIENLKPDKAIKPKVTITIASDNTETIEPIQMIAATLEFSSKTKDILCGYGDQQFLHFEHVIPNFDEKQQVLIRKEPKTEFIGNNSKKIVETNLKMITPIVHPNDVEYNTPIVLNKKKQKEIQIPMETRLQNLNLSKGEVPQAQSKVQLLVQALHSRDSNLLGTVLSTKNLQVIELTLQKLPVQYVGSLVNELTLLMQKKRMNVQIAGNWLKILIKTHSSQLMALGRDDLLTKFGPCLSIIEHRTNCLKDLSRLSGRLELLLNQIKRNTEEESLNIDNCLIYEDKDSSNSEMEEDDVGKSSSEGEWAEDESNDEMEIGV